MRNATALRSAPPAAAANEAQADKPASCLVCTCTLNAQEGDDLELGICASCQDRPEARRMGLGLAPLAARRPHVVAAAQTGAARDFTPAENSLISKVHGLMPAQQLLDLLNERLVCDLGPDANRYSLEQLQQRVSIFAPPAPAGGHDWASLRKVLAQARRSGVLAQVNEQVINDFAVVYSLNPKQVLGLKDILLNGEDAS